MPDPYHLERMGVPYKEFSELQRLDRGNGYVDPYQAEAHGIDYRSWRLYIEDFERRDAR